MYKRRCVIYPKDVQLITGKSERYGQELLTKIRDHYNKQPHQFITVQEFCAFSGIPLDEVEPYL
ncbi:hypothetical protein [Cognataquiflexum rubidum]|uniref:hypothetical protein n=1 Tax=Cognataquiflexum rubidum TaxID=2922273 RepID=UPI001F138962|nr:hypothetical protein [Cognataquiflexum rubidum]MCH6236036.1 hypothetical protein [Cognataquiflexum rubidum]